MNYLFVLFCFFFFSFQSKLKATEEANHGVYIVYMGAASQGSQRDLLLNSLPTRAAEYSVIHSYKNGFSGFAARLSEEEAQSIAQRPGVISVFRDPVLQLHTTHSWDFLYQTDLEMGLIPKTNDSSISHGGEDTIIGILDTGIWPESKSFSDEGMAPIPSRWKGICMAGHDFHPSSCNRKLIGARYYFDPESTSITDRSPRDLDGHGTHVASIAAGAAVKEASYHGQAKGTAKGGSPSSRIAVYRVCPDEFGCRGSHLLKAFDDAIADGVDIISLSLGALDLGGFSTDPIAIGAFHAVENQILVVGSAGYGRGYTGSVVNVATWILTVGATTTDRQFESNVLLSGNKLIKGGAINTARLKTSSLYPLIHGVSGVNNMSSEGEASNCEPNSLERKKVKGKIVLCENSDWESYSASSKYEEIIRVGGIGMILIDDNEKVLPSIYEDPNTATTIISSEDGLEILSYINSTRNPMATILPTVTAFGHKPAPSVAFVSGIGPIPGDVSLIKPDVVAPGVGILAAWRGNHSNEKGEKSYFNIATGSSVACPHVSAIAAQVKSHNPSWSPSAIRSAIMTTAIQTNNMKEPIQSAGGFAASPYDFGAGQVSLLGPLQPGLVYDMTNADYLQFLCNLGHNTSTIKLISSTIARGFSCARDSNINQIANMNYPSIGISINQLQKEKHIRVTRTLTNVGEIESVYTVIVDAPEGLKVQVTPKKLQFTESKKKLRYTVDFRLPEPLYKPIMFGSITWSNGKHRVRSPFAASF